MSPVGCVLAAFIGAVVYSEVTSLKSSDLLKNKHLPVAINCTCISRDSHSEYRLFPDNMN